MRDRAFRRHQAARWKARARRRTKLLSYDWYARRQEPSDRIVGLNYQTRVMCSGLCCGNPRKWFGHRTLQEIRYTQDAE